MTRTHRRLTLRTETLTPLTQDALRGVAGGFIMRDSVIVRTGRIAPDAPIDEPRSP